MQDLVDLLSNLLGKEAAIITFSLLAAAGYAILRLAWRELRRFACFLISRKRALDAVARKISKDGPREGNGVWLTQPIYQPEDYARSSKNAKVIVIANLKGGVGKTTLAANIGAFLAHDQRWYKRVLLIDLDFQGSLSSMALPEDERWLPLPGQDSLASRMVSGDFDPGILVSCAKATQPEPRLRVVTAHYDLAQADNRLLIEWLLRCRTRQEKSVRKALGDLLYGKLFKQFDVRYNLTELLHSDAAREAFDLIVIDCPPRLTTGTIQALCSASHLLIPTILDRPSAEAVMRFCEQIDTLKAGGICPHLNVLGIVGTKYRGGLLAENEAVQLLHDRLRDAGSEVKVRSRDLFFPQTTEVVRDSGQGIAYFTLGNNQQAQGARAAIARISEFVATQMGLPPRV